MGEKEGGAGVLLYYKYARLPDVSGLVGFYDSDCNSLGLLGRVRIAPDGVNVTIGGKMSALEKHIDNLKSMSLFDGTDFKLASCDHPSNDKIAKECGFTSLSIRVVKELVTFRSDPLLKSPEISKAGRHLSAVQFHSVLQNAEMPGNTSDSQACMQKNQLLLLDARNLYETRIGKFQAPNVETLDPEIRQYSDLPAWVDKNAEKLHGKHVLMYCTGGIRCEMASAYIRSKGAGFENVFRLYGGIQRYLEQFPDGGYFKGKNFVFDHRISVGSHDADILGSCIKCGSSFDDYTSRCRCTYCRMLVLVCGYCQDKSHAEYVCELCQNNGNGTHKQKVVQQNQLQLDLQPYSSEPVDIESFSSTDGITSFLEPRKGLGETSSRKLRVLCLHGFRQNALSFKGRTSSLAKKLRNMVEFVFIDAPHELPFIYKSRTGELSSTSSAKSLPEDNCKKKFAWLISSNSCYSMGPDWRIADEPFDPFQYQQQKGGFEKSYAYLETIFKQLGPFDGVLGFSQGAAMAALCCAQQKKLGATPEFRFVIMCSGFSLVKEVIQSSNEDIDYPSLHVFGNVQGEDRQISCQASRDLADLFNKENSVIIEHDMGHIIPTRSPYIDRMKFFLNRFL